MLRLLMVCVFVAQSIAGRAQSIPAYTADMLVQRISNPDTFYVVNFWATWCGPCVKELPEFDKLAEQYPGKPVKVLLVSLDFKNDYTKKLPRFIEKKKLQHEVIWFNETNANEFIPKLDPAWQGSIPATMMVWRKNEYQSFFEGSIKASQLQLLIDKQLALQN